MHELINTSVPNGLIPGSHGFSTVAMTRGMSDMLRTKLEMLSGYSHVYSGHDDQYFIQNPESWNHLILATGEHIFSRVAVAPFDYTGRTNRLAHHVVLSSQEIATFNPVDILKNGLYGILSAPWEGEPRWLEPRDVQTFTANVPPVTDCTPILWKEILGAGSERFIAQLATYYANLVTGKGRPICLVRSAQQIGNGAKMMALAKELIALLPPNIRHLATFSTYAPLFPAGVKCDLRVVTENDPHLAQIRQHSFCIDWGHGGVLNSSLLPEADASILNAVKTGCWQYIAPQKQLQAVSEKRYEPTPQQQPAYQSSQATSVQRWPQSQYAQPPRRTSSKPYVRTQSVSSQSKVASSSSSWKWWLVIASVVVTGVTVRCCISKNKEETPKHATSNQGDEEMRSAGEAGNASKTGADSPTYKGDPQSFSCEENREEQKKSSESLTQEPLLAEKESTPTNQQDGADSQQPVEPTTLPPEPVVNTKEEPQGVEQADRLAGGKKKENDWKVENSAESFKTRLEKCSEFEYCFNLKEVLNLLQEQTFEKELYCYYSEQNDSVGEPLFDFYQIKSSKFRQKKSFHLAKSDGDKIEKLSHAYFLCGNKLIVLLKEEENKKYIDIPDDESQALELLGAFCRHQEVGKKIKDDVFSKYDIEVDINSTVSFDTKWYNKELDESEKAIFDDWGFTEAKARLMKNGIKITIKDTCLCKKPVEVSCFILDSIRKKDQVLEALYAKITSLKSKSNNEDNGIKIVETLIGKWTKIYTESLKIKLKLVKRRKK